MKRVARKVDKPWASVPLEPKPTLGDWQRGLVTLIVCEIGPKGPLQGLMHQPIKLLPDLPMNTGVSGPPEGEGELREGKARLEEDELDEGII